MVRDRVHSWLLHTLRATPIACLVGGAAFAADDTLEGPTSVAQSLKPGGAFTDPLNHPQFRLGLFYDAFAPVFKAKDYLNQAFNLDVGFDYTFNGQVTSSELGAGSAAGHDMRFYGTWTLLNPDGPNSGALTFKVESRMSYTDVSPQDLGFDAGAVAITAAQFSDVGWVLNNLYWKQRFFDDRLTVGFGQIDVTDYVDLFPMANPLSGFQNLVFSVSPAIAAPNQGLGVATGIWLSEHVYANAGIADANGDPTDPDFSVFEIGETFQSVEIGYASSRERQFLDNFHVTAWSVDAREAAGISSDWGASMSASWGLPNGWAPFLRAGFADGGAVLYSRSASAGVGHLTREQDLMAVGLNWAQPGGGLEDQWSMEAFYRYQVSQHFAVTLDGQIIANPVLNPDQGLIGFLGLRTRLVY